MWWEAPRAAYLFTTAVHASDDRAADAIWEALPPSGGQADLVLALAAQARHVAVRYGRHDPAVADLPPGAPCARAWALAALLALPVVPPRPRCEPCLRQTATALVRLRVRLLAAAGEDLAAIAAWWMEAAAV